MADGWKGVLGEDGKYYTDTTARLKANAVVENQRKISKELEKQNAQQQQANNEMARQMAEAQRKQNEAIEMQSKIALLQAEQEERKMQQEKELEYERQEHEKVMEQTKYEHEKELLLLKKFDEISIPLEVYQKFEDNLFMSNNLKPEEAEQYGNLMKSATDILSKQMENSEQFQELLQRNMNYPNNEVKYTDKYKIFQEFVNNSKSITNIRANNFDVFDKDKQNLINSFNRTKEDMQQKNNYLSFTIKLNYALSIGELIAGLFIFPDFKILFIPAAIIQFIVATWAKSNNKIEQEVTKDFKQLLNKAINTQMANEYNQNNVSEEDRAILDKVKQAQEKLHESSKTIIDQRLQDLYNFRLEHYNLKIEKLFYDVGLVNKCIENNYNWQDINKNNIKSEGTYEDYFHYFNNYNPNNEEPQTEQ